MNIMNKGSFMRICRCFVVWFVCCFSPTAMSADVGQAATDAHWSVALKGGYFYPEESAWKDFYDDDFAPQFAFDIAYMFTQYIEAGASVGYIYDEGVALLPSSNTKAGSVEIRLAPVNVYVKLRGVLQSDQLFVPYVGGGWTEIFYQQKIANQSDVEGHASGYHFKGGVEMLLDNFDPYAARASRKTGIYHTRLFVEAEHSKVESDKTSVDIGGRSIWLGIRIDF